MASNEMLYNRDDLYREVWQEPMTTVAKRYGVSSVALAKTCDKLRVPSPPRGYWAKLKAGQNMKQPKLPEYPNPPKLSWTTKPDVSQNKAKGPEYHLPEVFAEARLLLDRELLPEHKIEVHSEYPRLHSYVAETKKNLSVKPKYEFQSPGRRGSGGESSFNVQIGVDSIQRVINILQALCVAFEDRTFELRKDEKNGLCVMAMGEVTRFRILEGTHKVPVEKKPKQSYAEFEYVSSGELRIELVDPTFGMVGQKVWRDTRTRKLEQVLNAVICSIILNSAWQKEYREHWRLQTIQEEIARKKREEIARLQALNEKRAANLAEDCQKWIRHQNLSVYFKEVRTRFADLERSGDDDYLKWIAWCEEYLTSIDPLKGKPPRYSLERDSSAGFGFWGSGR